MRNAQRILSAPPRENFGSNSLRPKLLKWQAPARVWQAIDCVGSLHSLVCTHEFDCDRDVWSGHGKVYRVAPAGQGHAKDRLAPALAALAPGRGSIRDVGREVMGRTI